eukprot:6468214-Pyramimonas_sp.AAC.2
MHRMRSLIPAATVRCQSSAPIRSLFIRLIAENARHSEQSQTISGFSRLRVSHNSLTRCLLAASQPKR